MTKTVTVLVEVIIFVSVIGVIASNIVGTTQNNSNITGASAVMIGLVTLFVVIGFILILLKQLKMSR